MRGRGRGGAGGRGRGSRDGGGRGGGGGGPREPPAIITGRTDILRDPFCTIIARNVPFHATETDIIHFFTQAGKVVLWTVCSSCSLTLFISHGRQHAVTGKVARSIVPVQVARTCPSSRLHAGCLAFVLYIALHSPPHPTSPPPHLSSTVSLHSPIHSTPNQILLMSLQSNSLSHQCHAMQSNPRSQVVDVVRGASADGKLHTWLTVQFDCKEAAEKALSLSGADMLGRSVTVEPSTAMGESKLILITCGRLPLKSHRADQLFAFGWVAACSTRACTH